VGWVKICLTETLMPTARALATILRLVILSPPRSKKFSSTPMLSGGNSRTLFHTSANRLSTGPRGSRLEADSSSLFPSPFKPPLRSITREGGSRLFKTPRSTLPLAFKGSFSSTSIADGTIYGGN